MSRREDSTEFYEILRELGERVGGCRRLRDCTGKSGQNAGCISFSRTENFAKTRKP
jgi:hypothetical protein